MLMLQGLQGVCFLVYTCYCTSGRELLPDVHELDGDLGLILFMPA